MSGVGSTEPPEAEVSALPAPERKLSGVGSTEPPEAEVSALPTPERE